MTIGIKISQAFGALVALTTFGDVVTTLNISHMNRDVQSIVEGPLPGVYSMGLFRDWSRTRSLAGRAR